MTTQADLQNAIDAMSLAGGGVVPFSGEVTCAPVGGANECLIIRSGVTLSGNGGKLKLASGSIDITSIVKFDEGAEDASLHWMTIDGNRWSGASVGAVRGAAGGKNLALDTVTMRSCAKRTLMSNADPATEAFVEGFHIRYSRIFDAGDKAFEFRNTRGGSLFMGYVETNPTDLSDPSDSAFEASNSEDINFSHLFAKHLVATTGPSFRAVNGSKRVTFSQGRSIGGRQHILVIGASHVHFRDLFCEGGMTGAMVQGNSPLLPNMDDIVIDGVTFIGTGTEGVRIASSAPYTVKGVRVTNCTFRGPMQYGIRNTAGALGSQISQTGNIFEGMTLANVSGI